MISCDLNGRTIGTSIESSRAAASAAYNGVHTRARRSGAKVLELDVKKRRRPLVCPSGALEPQQLELVAEARRAALGCAALLCLNELAI